MNFVKKYLKLFIGVGVLILVLVVFFFAFLPLLGSILPVAQRISLSSAI